MDERNDSPDWEILKLLREVRRRVRAGNPQRFLDHLQAEPKWVAALPAAEAKVARTMLEATRELAQRAMDNSPIEAEIELFDAAVVAPAAVLPPEPVEEPVMAVVGAKRRRAPRVLSVQAAGVEPRRRRTRAS